VLENGGKKNGDTTERKEKGRRKKAEKPRVFEKETMQAPKGQGFFPGAPFKPREEEKKV